MASWPGHAGFLGSRATVGMLRRQRYGVSEKPARLHLSLREAMIAVFVITAASAIAILSQPYIGLAAATLLFGLGVMLVGATQGLAPALLSALLAFLIFNFFLSEPFHTLGLTSGRDLVPLIAFNVAAVIAGALAGQLRDRAEVAERARRQLQLLLNSSNRIHSSITQDEVIAQLRNEASHSGLQVKAFRRLPDGSLQGDAPHVAHDAFERGETVHLNYCTAMPLVGSEGITGAMVAEESLELADEGLLDAYCNLIALALERADLLERKSEAGAAARSEKLKTALLSSVSHDFRTPLATISASASSLLSYGHQFDDAQRSAMLQTIVDECQQLNRYTANLLELSRLQAGDQIDVDTIEVADSVSVAVARARPLAGDRTITVASKGVPLFVNCNPAMFDLVLLNVLTNSITYSHTGSEIAVEVFSDGDQVAIEIRDEGIGIPDSQLETAFERFHRVARGGSAPRGSGLGLAIAKGFVEAFEGRIWAATPGLGGRGTLIAIRLPRASVSAWIEQ